MGFANWADYKRVFMHIGKTIRMNIWILLVLFLVSCDTSHSNFVPIEDAEEYGFDTTPPKILTTDPIDGATDVPVNTDITIVFDEPMNTSNIPDQSFQLSNGIKISLTYDDNTFVLTPLSPLDFSTLYTITIPGYVEDAFGNEMGKDYTWSFITETENIPPEVVSTNPMPDELNISPDVEIRIEFDEAIDPDSVTSESVIVGEGLPGTVIADGSTIIFNPSISLFSGTTYTVTISGNIMDSAGNMMGFPYSWSFTTRPLSVDLGKICNLLAGAQPEYMYALDQDNTCLYIIDLSSQQVVYRVDIPFIWPAVPSSFAFSPMNESLYIVSDLSRRIFVCDLNSFTFTDTYFSLSLLVFGALDIEVAPNLRRIYTLYEDATGHSLSIMNLDTNIILLDESIIGSSLILDEASLKVFSCSGSSLYKYSIYGDALSLEQTMDLGSHINHLAISPDGLRLAVCCDDFLYDVETDDIENILGHWDLDSPPTYASFHPNADIIFVTSQDDMLHVMNSISHQPINSVNFTNSGDYAIISPNSDGSIVAGFSYNTTNNTDYDLYFFADELGL